MSIRGKCNSCCVPGCNSNSTPSFRNRGGRITTFKLPRDEKRRKEWIQAIPKRKYPPTVNHNVCILHFNEEDFSRNNRRIDLKKSAVPSIFPFVNGQKNDENGDVCDEVWAEYEAHRKDSANRKLENVSENLPTTTSDLSRILIDRLRIPGAKYFGIDTADITIEPDSDNESDLSEQNTTMDGDRKATINTEMKPISKKIKFDRFEQETNNASSDDFDITDTKPHIEDPNDKSNEQLNPLNLQTSIGLEDLKLPNDDDKFGAMVSSKLLLMSPLQRLMSQKIISEILLNGQLGMLKSSLSPVLVPGYMKNISNGATNTSHVASEHLTYYDSDDDDANDDDHNIDEDDDGSDPLTFQVKQESRETDFETYGIVKDEISWSDDEN